MKGHELFLGLALLFTVEIDTVACWNLSRRTLLDSTLLVAIDRESNFVTSAYGKQEYTNSITASRDTNLSPAEAYDVIRQRIPPASSDESRALDLGAGAGLSTAVLFLEKHYRSIDAVDWSATAWEESVQQQPETVRFQALDDDRFFRTCTAKYDAIVYNFAVNPDKALRVARQFLTDTGVLLAPCNDRTDYWYKQSYVVLNREGNVLWKSDQEVGAWSVQFQPDVTSPNCTGPWCQGFNGYH